MYNNNNAKWREYCTWGMYICIPQIRRLCVGSVVQHHQNKKKVKQNKVTFRLSLLTGLFQTILITIKTIWHHHLMNYALVIFSVANRYIKI